MLLSCGNALALCGGDCYHGAMADTEQAKRLTDMWSGKSAAWLLALLWIVSMPVFDTNACTSFPLVVLEAAVSLLWLSGIVRGGKMVQWSWLNFLSMAVGAYFLFRCLNSYSVVESWRESVLIGGCVLFYVGGIYAAQSRRLRTIGIVITVALLLNMAALFIMRMPTVPLEWTGRPSHGFAGENSRLVTLFVYKNNAGAFLLLGAAMVTWLALWGKMRWFLRVGLFLFAAAGATLSFCCGTRCVYALLPLIIVLGWTLHFVCSLYSGRKVGWATICGGVLLFVAVCIGAYEFIFSGGAYERIMGTDTHLRSYIWSFIYRLAPNAPWWGYGTGASQWEVVPFFNEWQTPNYAHNEYLQAWMDYGVIGVSLVFFIILSHAVFGMRALASEQVSDTRRQLTCLSLLVLGAMSLYAIADFPWHHYALAGMTAFACGVLGSPYPHPAFSLRRWAMPRIVSVRAQGRRGRGLVALGCVAFVCLSVWQASVLYRPWLVQWEYNSLFRPGADEEAVQRRALLVSLLPEYPEPSLMDCYQYLPSVGGTDEQLEQWLKQALKGNPRQRFTVVMLADVLDRQQKFAETEALLRESYEGDGMPRSILTDWVGNYAMHLLLWGRYELETGHRERALSILQYAFKVANHTYFAFDYRYRSGEHVWQQNGGYKPLLKNLLQCSKLDVSLLRRMKVEPDDSWMQPMRQGGKPALYRRWGLESSDKSSNIRMKGFKLPIEWQKIDAR